jgi:VWFA-related protein
MHKSSALLLSLTLLLTQSLTVFAQEGQQPSSPPKAPQQQQSQDENNPYNDEVVRISTNLVQVDAVVTDRDGRYVTDLRPEDFEISEDGKRQAITNFSYVELAQNTAPEPRRKTEDARTEQQTTLAPAVLKPEQVRRTMALVVDDLCLSQESVSGVRKALKKFVNEQMQTGDLVAILRTSAGLGTLQQFTADKRVLEAAIERVKFYPGGRCGISAVQPQTGMDLLASSSSESPGLPSYDQSGVGPDQMDQTRSQILTIGTIGAINYVVRGLRELPGRKAVVLFSDGFKLIDKEAVFGGRSRTDKSDQINDSIKRLVDFANRASVVIYSMDARGLQTLGYSAADQPTSINPVVSAQGLLSRSAEFFDSQDGLNLLAKETGGIFVRSLNDLSLGMRRVIEDQKGYYLIGYRPDESTFDKKTGERRFHNLSVKVKRSGLSVRSRTGFYGVAESDAQPRTLTPRQQLLAALVSPFNSSGIDIRMTSIFGNDQSRGSYMRSVVYVNANDLKFTEEAGGSRKALIDLAAVTFDGGGKAIDQIIETREVSVTAAGYRDILRNGLTYALDVPVKQAGAYQLRVAVRDSASMKTGSASQFILVPDISRGRLGVSGLSIAGVSAEGNAGAQAGAPAQAQSETQFGPAARRLRQGMFLDYGYIIYNAQVDKATGKPQITTQVRLFREGKLLFTGKVASVDTGQQKDLRRLVTGGRIQTGAQMPPGDYVLHITVTDPLGKEKQRVVTQWTDFQIVK